jgi:hypothetical protein
MNNLVLTEPSCPKCCVISFSMTDFGNFLCVSHRKTSPSTPPPRPPITIVNLASDWLGVDLEVRSLSYQPTPQTGYQRIKKWIHSTYGSLPIFPPDIVSIVFTVAYNSQRSGRAALFFFCRSAQGLRRKRAEGAVGERVISYYMTFVCNITV